MSKEEKDQLRVVSDGTSMGTRIYLGDKWIRGVSSIKIEEISVSSHLVRAHVTFEKLSLDMILNQADISVEDRVTASKIEQAILAGDDRDAIIKGDDDGLDIEIVDTREIPKKYTQSINDEGRIVLEIKEPD